MMIYISTQNNAAAAEEAAAAVVTFAPVPNANNASDDFFDDGGSSDDSSAAVARDSYTAELLRAKMQRDLAQSISQRALYASVLNHGSLNGHPLSVVSAGGDDLNTSYNSAGNVTDSHVISYGSRRGDSNSRRMAVNTTEYDGKSKTSIDSSRRNNVKDVRSYNVLQSSGVLSLLQELGESDHDVIGGSGGGHGHHSGGGDGGHHHRRIPFYAYPEQRQRWGDPQVLPHINWADLFFDLFYVAAAYNLGTLLISAMTPTLWPRGIVYFLGCFGSIFSIWESKLVYEARYTVRDYAHQLLEIVRVFLLSFAVLHIKSIEQMSDPKSSESFFFTLGVFLESLISIALKVELICVGKGDVEAIRNHSRRKIYAAYLPQSLFYLAATITAGVQFWDGNSPSDGGDGEMRLLASTEDTFDGWRLSDLPITICLLAYVFSLLYHISKVYFLPKMDDFRKWNVPSNIDFLIHRYGEWTMLMLGESVLSLLIVDTTESVMYYVVAILGVLTVILLQVVKFESEPSHAEGHALWRNLTMGMVYAILVQVLSFGLVAFGVSYKTMLKSIHKDSEKSDNSYDSGVEGSEYPEDRHRFLAPAVGVTNQASAALFCGSLTIVLVALECMTNSHRGQHDSIEHFFHPSQWRHEAGGTIKFALFIFKLLLIVFTATLSQWLTTPSYIATAGFFIVGTFAVLRVTWWNYVHYNFDRIVRQTISERKIRQGEERNEGTESGRSVQADEQV